MSATADTLNLSRHAALKQLAQESTLVEALLRSRIKHAAALPEDAPEMPGKLAEMRELLEQFAELTWCATELKMRMSGEIPEWETAEAMHHRLEDRHAYIRLEGEGRHQVLLMESFDAQGQARLERVSIFDFHPAQWDVIPRTLYAEALAKHLEAGTLTWTTELVHA